MDNFQSNANENLDEVNFCYYRHQIIEHFNQFINFEIFQALLFLLAYLNVKSKLPVHPLVLHYR